jgi:hypothetical protein
MNLEVEQIADMFRGLLLYEWKPSSQDMEKAILFLEELRKKRSRLLELIQVLDDDDCISHGLDWVLAEMREILGSDE